MHMSWIVAGLLASVVALGCNNDTPKKAAAANATPGAANLHEGGRAVITELLASRDDAVRALLVSAEQCPTLTTMMGAPNEQFCADFVTTMHGSFDAWRKKIGTFEIVKVQDGRVPPGAPAGIHAVELVPADGRDPFQLGAIEVEGRFFYLLPPIR